MIRQRTLFGAEPIQPKSVDAAKAFVVPGRGIALETTNEFGFRDGWLALLQTEHGNLRLKHVHAIHHGWSQTGVDLGQIGQPADFNAYRLNGMGPRELELNTTGWRLAVPFAKGRQVHLLLQAWFAARRTTTVVWSNTIRYAEHWSKQGVAAVYDDELGVAWAMFGLAPDLDWRPSETTPEDFYAL